MKNLRPSRVSISQGDRDENDIRVRDVVERYIDGRRYDIAIVGVPFDYGVRLSRGRPGARGGPDAVRCALRRAGTVYNIEHEVYFPGLRVCDLGNVAVVERDSAETHARVSEVVAWALDGGMLPIVIGGGHDITFANVRGLCSAGSRRVGGINIDAHFDVREAARGGASSGTPFRRILEELDGAVSGRNLVEIGAHGNANSLPHHRYLLKRGARVITLDGVLRDGAGPTIKDALSRAGSGTEASFLSVDMDSLPQWAAPGVSAPSPCGVPPDAILEMCFAAGADKKLGLFDIMELNPRYDIGDRTALLAAHMIVSFLSGFATRKGMKK